MFKRFSAGAKSRRQLTDEADETKANDQVGEAVQLVDASEIGQGRLTREGIRLMLPAQNKLAFWKKANTAALDLDTTLSCMEPSDCSTLRLGVEQDGVWMIGVKVSDTLRCIGVEKFEVVITKTKSRSSEGKQRIDAKNALTLDVSGVQNVQESSSFTARGSTPSNILSSRDNLDRQFIRTYGLEDFVQKTCNIYDDFISGKVESLAARSEVHTIDLKLEAPVTRILSTETEDDVQVNTSASNQDLIEVKLVFAVTLLSDQHAGLLEKRREENAKKKLAEEVARKAEAEKEFIAIEARCKDNLDTASAGYQVEMNNDLEKLASDSPWSWFWNEHDRIEKKFLIVGTSESGKSTLVWLMSTLARRNWEDMDKDVHAGSARRPLGNAEASCFVARVPLNVLLPSRRVVVSAVDIQGEGSNFGVYKAGAPNQLIVVVVRAIDLFTPEGDLVPDFDEKFSLLPHAKDAAAIVVTKWDELKFGVVFHSNVLLTNVDQFWSSPDCVVFSKLCMEKLQDKTQAKVFAFRMPIREEGSTRTYQARYQMCCGVKQLMLFLIRQMK